MSVAMFSMAGIMPITSPALRVLRAAFSPPPPPPAPSPSATAAAAAAATSARRTARRAVRRTEILHEGKIAGRQRTQTEHGGQPQQLAGRAARTHGRRPALYIPENSPDAAEKIVPHLSTPGSASHDRDNDEYDGQHDQ